MEKVKWVASYNLHVCGLTIEERKKILQLNRYIACLRSKKYSLPPDKALKYIDCIEEITGSRIIPKKKIEWKEHPDYVDVWKKIYEDVGFDYLLNFWIKHFETTMEPKFMPDWWNK